MSDVPTLESMWLKCPKCGGADRLGISQLETMINPIEVSEDGKWDWGGDHIYRNSNWDLEDDLDSPGRFFCITCGIWFNAPYVMQVDGIPSDRAMLMYVLNLAKTGEINHLGRIRKMVESHLEVSRG